MQEDSDQTLNRHICFTNAVTSLTRPIQTLLDTYQTPKRPKSPLYHYLGNSFLYVYEGQTRWIGTVHGFKVSLFQAYHLKSLNVSNLALNELTISLKRGLFLICQSKWLQIINGALASPFPRQAIWKVEVETEDKISKLITSILCSS